jgi:hypothetical protein
MLFSRPRFQVALRAVLTVMVLCTVALGVYIVDNRLVNAALWLIAFAAPWGAIAGTAIRGRRGAPAGTLAGVVGGGLTGIIGLFYNWSVPVEDNLLALGLLAGWLVALLLYWTFRQISDTPDGQASVRAAARFSLVPVALAIPLSLLRSHLKQQGATENSDPLWAVDVMEAVVMGSALLPWIVLARRRAAGPAGRPYTRWDTATKVLLLIAAILGPATEGLAVFLFFVPIFHGPYAGLAQLMLVGLTLEVGLGTASVCFATGFIIQVWRDRWYLPVTIVNVLWLVGLWMYVVAGMPLP